RNDDGLPGVRYRRPLLKPAKYRAGTRPRDSPAELLIKGSMRPLSDHQDPSEAKSEGDIESVTSRAHTAGTCRNGTVTCSFAVVGRSHVHRGTEMAPTEPKGDRPG